jgi:hypothetical protein
MIRGLTDETVAPGLTRSSAGEIQLPSENFNVAP